MKIVPMDRSHVADIVEMEKLYFSDPWSENAFLSELNSRFSFWLVAVEDDRVIGYVGAQTALDQADMMNLAVREEHRRQGVADKLVQALINVLKAQNVFALMLEVRVSNAPAIALYEKLGFCQVGRRPNYYFKPREDALIMRKEWEL